MRITNVLRLYVVRLRARLVQELFAVAGVAVGVALLFSSQVAQDSLSGSVRALDEGIAGNARYEVAARGPEGFPEAITKRVADIHGVAHVAPLLEVNANIVGPHGERSVVLIGADAQIAALGGALLRHIGTGSSSQIEALAVPQPIASATGLSLLGAFTLQVAGNNYRSHLGEELGEAQIGALIGSPVAVGPLAYVRKVAGLEGRVSRLLVQPSPGSDATVHRALERIAAGRLDVHETSFQAALVDQAALVTNQSTDLFSAITAFVGFLFAFNAIRMTLSHRRRLIEDLRLDGYGPAALTELLLLDALVLGALASILGLALGELLSSSLFASGTAYLSLAFPIGSQRVVGWQTIPIAVGGGMLLTLVSVLGPFRQLYSRQRRRPRMPILSGLGKAQRWAPVAGLACVVISTAIVLIDPAAAASATVILALALLLVLPAMIAGSLHVLAPLANRIKTPAPLLAVIELRSTVTRTRSLAVAATGAIAVFGVVAIDGTRENLRDGLNRTTHEIASVADIWITPRGAGSVAATSPLHPLDLSPLERLPGVEAIHGYAAAALDWGQRRLWVIAPPRQATTPIPPSELVSGEITRATRRIQGSGWVVISRPVAEEHHLRVGQSFTLPSPTPSRFRVAALSTNIDWPPGAIIMNAEDYAHAWSSQRPTAYNVILKPGASATHVRHELQAALAGRSGVAVETAEQRERRLIVLVGQSVTRAAQISVLVLIAAILAMSVVMGDLIYQRRARFASMKVDGLREGVLWQAVVLESAALMGSGCAIGALFGLYAQPLLGHALRSITGFAVLGTWRVALALEIVALVSAVSVAILAVPGRIAARVDPQLSFGE